VKRLFKRYCKSLFVVLIVISVIISYLGYSIWSFSYENQQVKTDAAIVLGAAVWNEEPSPVFKERINHGIWLYQHGYVEKLIFTGGRSTTNHLSEAEVAHKYAILHGVPEGDILIETESRITEENLENAYLLSQQHRFRSFTIVSDPLHMKRAMVMTKKLGMLAYSSPTPASAYKTLQSKLPFFFRELFFYTGYLLTLPFRKTFKRSQLA
jgi:uncharacterized SAM-binding protein YcdF (DUF218 family)